MTNSTYPVAVVVLPVFFISVLGWDFWLAGGFMAAWTIGYGFVQTSTPGLIRRRVEGDHEPAGGTAMRLTFGLAAFPVGIALALMNGVAPALAVVVGLLAFGVIFALNSAVHSYLILVYTDSDKVAMNVGFYYMANAMGRLACTVLSGLLYQYGLQFGPSGGLVACRWASAAFVLTAGDYRCSCPKAPHGQSRSCSTIWESDNQDTGLSRPY